MKSSKFFIFYFLLSLITLGSPMVGHDINRSAFGEPDTLITLIWAGDVMGHSPQFEAAYNDEIGRYEYDICFANVKNDIEHADFAIANLEVPLAGKPYSGYPNFSSPDELLDGLQNAGFDIILTANNHVVDRGKQGLERTLHQLKSRSLYFAGSYLNQKQRDTLYPVMIRKHGIKIALLNYTYGTNGIVVTEPNVVNYIDSAQIEQDIRKADSLGADFKIMTVHWGTEYQLHSNKKQQGLAQYFADLGVDAIIGGHPHVVQEYSVIYNKAGKPIPVYYSIGNYISNQRKPHTDGGIMVELTLNTRNKSIQNNRYIPVYVYKGILHNQYQYHLIPTYNFVENPLAYQIPSEDSTKLLFFHEATIERLKNEQYR
ncbi:MAG: CapA family protein [Bacteroidales bacterium]